MQYANTIMKNANFEEIDVVGLAELLGVQWLGLLRQKRAINHTKQ